MRSLADITAVSKDIGGVDVLVNCAGIVANGSILDSTEEDWAASFDINVTSMFRLIRATLPGMLERGGGSIVNISIGGGLHQGRAQSLHLRRDQGGHHRVDQVGRG